VVQSAFLGCWNNKRTSLAIVSLNIHGIKDKLQNAILSHFLSTFDIIFLNELKTDLPVSFPGYVYYRGTGENLHRGGCALLIKNYLANQIASVATPNAECVLVKLKFLPNLTIMACFLTPSDSQYHSLQPLAEMQHGLSESPQDRYLIIGDMNARFGASRDSFLTSKDLPEGTLYRPTPDTIERPNNNAKYIMSTFQPTSVLLNSLSVGNVKMSGDLTFCMGNNWTSELDVCLVSNELVTAVTSFTVHQQLSIPSDHAPISVEEDGG
jgi:exonuclease III